MDREQVHPSGEGAGVSEEEFSALLEGVSRMAPLLKGVFGTAGASGAHPKSEGEGRELRGCERREALLCSLKPYLSPERCAAVDYLIRLARVGDAIRALQ